MASALFIQLNPIIHEFCCLFVKREYRLNNQHSSSKYCAYLSLGRHEANWKTINQVIVPTVVKIVSSSVVIVLCVVNVPKIKKYTISSGPKGYYFGVRTLQTVSEH